MDPLLEDGFDSKEMEDEFLEIDFYVQNHLEVLLPLIRFLNLSDNSVNKNK